MASVKHEQPESCLTQDSHETVQAADATFEPADFELDECLRTLRLDEWFAMVEEGMPIWVC